VNALFEHLMMLYTWVWSVSAKASVLVVLILLLHVIPGRYVKPRWQRLLWLLLLLRLTLPWNMESAFSIFNWIGGARSAPTAAVTGQGGLPDASALGMNASSDSIYLTLFWMWLSVAVLLGGYTAWVNLRFARRLKRYTISLTTPALLKLFAECKKRMRLRQNVTLRSSRWVTTPTLYGIVRPQLIVPDRLINSLSEEQMQHVFLHELAHCKRRDIAFNWLMQVMLVLHWFNPLLWYAQKRMREDQELESDALALACLAPDSGRSYGLTLIHVLESFSQPVQTAGNMNLMGSKAQLQRRIQMIKQFKTGASRWSILGIVLLVVISGCTLTNPKSDKAASPSPSPDAQVTQQPGSPSPSPSLAPTQTTSASPSPDSSPELSPSPSSAPPVDSASKPRSESDKVEIKPSEESRSPQVVPAPDTKVRLMPDSATEASPAASVGTNIRETSAASQATKPEQQVKVKEALRATEAQKSTRASEKPAAAASDQSAELRAIEVSAPAPAPATTTPSQKK
jgi:bla regulator protein BlaR1